MFSINTIYIFLFILVFIIIFTTKLLEVKAYDGKKILLDCSFFFDRVSEDSDVKKTCAISEEDFGKLRLQFEKFLNYLNNVGFIKSRIFVMNKDKCFFYGTDYYLKICRDYNKSKDKDCLLCQKFWKSIREDPGVILTNNLIKKESRKDIILYKTYDCKKDDTFIIGVICQDKF